MDATTALGLIAGALTTASLVPQVLKIWKTKSAEDVSLAMFIAFCCGVSLWLIYGVLSGDVPIVVWNSITLALGLAIVTMKVKYT